MSRSTIQEMRHFGQRMEHGHNIFVAVVRHYKDYLESELLAIMPIEKKEIGKFAQIASAVGKLILKISKKEPFVDEIVHHGEKFARRKDADGVAANMQRVDKEVPGGNFQYIRAFDLGGGGLKTAVLRYDLDTRQMEWVEHQAVLGKCPDYMEVSEWIRSTLAGLLDKDLDAEIGAGYLYSFSLAGLDKLRTGLLEGTDMAALFRIPAERTSSIDDGAAHLIAGLKSLVGLPHGPIWNFSIGTGVGFGFTDDEHRVRKFSGLWTFFGKAPWYVKELRTGTEVFRACGAQLGFDGIVAEHHGVVNDACFIEFAERWKSFIEKNIIDYSTIGHPDKNWATPVAVVLSGGHIDIYGSLLADKLQKLGLRIPVFTGPRGAGLMGAAWLAVVHSEQ